MSEKILDVNDLSVVYKTDEGDVYALNGVSLSLNKGETLGLVGETGAGKTTLALSIMKLLPQNVGKITSGDITFDDKDIIKASEADMRAIRGNDISMIFADPMSSLNPIHTVGRQIGEVIELHNPKFSKAQIEEKVEEMLDLVGIPPERKDDCPHQFSGGMKQRIVIAIALACSPKMLLADEPTTALDVTIQAQVLQMMNDLKEKFNTAMLLITHDLGVVAQVCSSVAIIYAGKIIEIGTVEDIFEGEYHHPYTVGLFGSIPDIVAKTRRLTPIEGLMPDPTVHIPGCAFSDRCPRKIPECKTVVPLCEKVNATHSISCHLYKNLHAEQRS